MERAVLLLSLAAVGETAERAAEEMEPVAHVGIGKEEAVQSVEVVWPGGERAFVESPSVDQLLTIPYPSPE